MVIIRQMCKGKSWEQNLQTKDLQLYFCENVSIKLYAHKLTLFYYLLEWISATSVSGKINVISACSHDIYVYVMFKK